MATTTKKPKAKKKINIHRNAAGIPILDNDYRPVRVPTQTWEKVSSSEIDEYLKKKHKNTKDTKLRKIARRHILMQKKHDMAPRGKDITIAQSDAPWQIVYGKTRIPGIITFAYNAPNSKSLHLIVTLAGHRIDWVDNVIVDNDFVLTWQEDGWSSGPRPATPPAMPLGTRDFYRKVFHSFSWTLGTPLQTAEPNCHAQLPSLWPDDCKQSGRAHIYLIFVWDANTWPEGGVPELHFDIRGQQVYDPRNGQTAWSVSGNEQGRNPALCIADYLTDTEYGCGYSWDDIDEDSLIAAANVCDESVPLRAGGTEKRYTMDGYFTTEDDPTAILRDMASAMAGYVLQINGKWKFFPGVWRAPVMDLTDDDLRGEVHISIHDTQKVKFNSVRGRITMPSQKYQLTDYPAVSVNAWVSEDNGEKIWEELDLPLTQSPGMAQRIARIYLEDTRRDMVVSAPWSPKAYPLEVGDVVRVTLSRYGFVNTTFTVTDYTFGMDDDGEVVINLDLQETDAGVYSWNELVDEQLVSDAPDTYLPSLAYVSPPTGLHAESGTSYLDQRSDGTIFSRMYVSWDLSPNGYVTDGGRVELQYKKDSDPTWRDHTAVPGDSTNLLILDVLDTVAYNVRARFVNAAGVRSVWCDPYTHTIVGKTAKPTSITVGSYTLNKYGLTLSWTGITDLDLSEYLVRVTHEGETTLLYAGRATSYTANITQAGDYAFFITALDTTGNESTTPFEIDVSLDPPSVHDLVASIADNAVKLEWAATSAAFTIDTFEVRISDSAETFDDSDLLAITADYKYLHVANFLGEKRFWVRAKDINNNWGEAVSTTVTISAPAAVSSFTAEVIDNNIMLRWTRGAVTSLPLGPTRIYKGATFGGAVLLGELAGTFAAYFELNSGTYTYWAVQMDSAGNASTAVPVTATVSQPPDFLFRGSTTFVLTDGTLTNAAVLDSKLYAPITAEEWQEHFSNHSWLTPQDQIDAGYPVYAEPTPATASAVFVWDTGAMIYSGTLITAAYLQTQEAGTVTITPKISYSADGLSWTDGPSGSVQVYGSGFQYVKLELDFAGTDDKSISSVQNISLTLSVKQKKASGMATFHTADMPRGTLVNFSDVGASFIDVSSLQITAQKTGGATALIPIYDFVDVANPTGFRVIIYNGSGTPVDNVPFSWEASGV